MLHCGQWSAASRLDIEGYFESVISDRKLRRKYQSAFKYGFITAIMTLLVVYFCTSELNIKIDPFAEFLVLIWIPITVCFISFIMKNAYEGVNSRTGRIVCVIMGCCGLYLVIATLVEIITRVEPLVINGEISARFGHLFSGICLTVY